VFGTDNSLMLDTLAAIRNDDPIQWRGVAGVDQSVTDAEFERMHAVGVRGVRIKLLFPGGVSFSTVEPLSARLAGLGWHVQFLVDVSKIERLAERLDRLPTDSVIDHMGHIPAQQGIGDPGFDQLLALLKAGRTWVKLSGPNRVSSRGQAPFKDVDAFVTERVSTRNDRCLFGTDWPHVQLHGPIPNDGDLVDEFHRLVPDA